MHDGPARPVGAQSDHEEWCTSTFAVQLGRLVAGVATAAVLTGVGADVSNEVAEATGLTGIEETGETGAEEALGLG